MTEEEIVYLFKEHYATSGGVNSVFAFARAIEHRTLTKQKARWYYEGVEAGLRKALVESPNSTTNVVEPEEPLCYLQEIDTLGGAYEQVAWGEGFPVYTAPQNMEVESTQAQELYGKTEQLEAEIKRLQEREWVGLTDEDMEGMFLNAEGIRIARYIEARLKEMNNG